MASISLVLFLSSVFFDAKLLLNVLFVSDMNIFKSSLALKSTELRRALGYCVLSPVHPSG